MKCKQVASLLLTAAFCSCLIGCGDQGVGRGGPSDSEGEPSTGSSQSVRGESVTPISYSGYLSDTAISPKGLYTVKQVHPGSYNIFFIDANSGQSSYLCASPNCAHDSDACSSFLPTNGAEWGYQSFFYQDKLYLLSANSTSAPMLMRCNADGSDRETVTSLKNGESIMGMLFGYGDSVLCEMFCPNGGNSTTQLEQINLETGSRKTLIVYPSDQNKYTLTGAAGNELVYSCRGGKGQWFFTVNPAVEGQDLAACAEQNAICEPFQESSVNGTVQGDYLCFYDMSSKTLSYKNLLTGEEQSFSAPQLNDGEKLYGLVHLFDDKFALNLDGKNNTPVFAMIDSKTGKLTGARYTMTREEPMTILGISGDKVICQSQDIQQQTEEVGNLATQAVYSVMSKQQYLKGESGIEVSLPVR